MHGRAPPADRRADRAIASARGTPPAPTAGQGASAGASGGKGSDGALGWWIAGLAMVAVILLLLVRVLAPNQGRTDTATQGPPPAPAAGPTGGAAAVDLSSMTPREAADRLFERVMRAVESGDSAQAQQFLPMAVAAYERARPLNLDGLFHLSILQRTSLEFEEALATARQGLEEAEDHVLLLSAAAEAAREMGDTETAREYYSRLLESYDQEVASDRQEYQAHAQLLPRLREDARAFLEEG